MTEDEAKQKWCPKSGIKCVGSECMGWKKKRRILPHYISITKAIQEKYKNIEVILYNGLEFLTILDGECLYFEEKIFIKNKDNKK